MHDSTAISALQPGNPCKLDLSMLSAIDDYSDAYCLNAEVYVVYLYESGIVEQCYMKVYHKCVGYKPVWSE